MTGAMPSLAGASRTNTMNFLLFSDSRQGVVWVHLHQAMFPPSFLPTR